MTVFVYLNTSKQVGTPRNQLHGMGRGYFPAKPAR
jgi:hypothetical protein